MEKTAENAWSMLMKFGTEENLKKLQAGQLYMKNLQYYVNLEKQTYNENVGDKYEGQMMLQDTYITMYEANTHKYVGQFKAPTASINFGYHNCPVFCMFMFDYRNHIDENLEGDNLTVRYQFTKEQIEKMPAFGDAVLIIKNGNEFFDRVNKALLSKGYGYTRNLVKYYNFNNVEQLKEINDDNLQVVFWKRQKYSYQQEYRLLIHHFVDDHFSVDIGDISDITCLLKTEQLLNTYFEVKFKVKPIGEAF